MSIHDLNIQPEPATVCDHELLYKVKRAISHNRDDRADVGCIGTLYSTNKTFLVGTGRNYLEGSGSAALKVISKASPGDVRSLYTNLLPTGAPAIQVTKSGVKEIVVDYNYMVANCNEFEFAHYNSALDVLRNRGVNVRFVISDVFID